MDKKQKIEPDDIDVKNLPRRKFLLGVSGTVVAVASSLGTGCGSGGCDESDVVVDMDSDTSDPISFSPDDCNTF